MVTAEINQPMARMMCFRTIHVNRVIAMLTMVDMMMKRTLRVDFIMVGRVIERVIVAEFLRVFRIYFFFSPVSLLRVGCEICCSFLLSSCAKGRVFSETEYSN